MNVAGLSSKIFPLLSPLALIIWYCMINTIYFLTICSPFFNYAPYPMPC